MVMKKGAGSNGLLSLWTGFTLFYVCLKWLIENITRPEKKNSAWTIESPTQEMNLFWDSWLIRDADLELVVGILYLATC